MAVLLVGVAPAAAEGEDPARTAAGSVSTAVSPWPAPPDALAPQVTASALPAIRASGASLSAATPLSFTLTNLDDPGPQVTATISATGTAPGNLHVDLTGLALVTTSTATEMTLRGTPADVITALAERLSWTAPSQIGQVTISAEVRQDLPADTYFNPANGNYYRFVSATENFDSASNSAAASGLWGLPGYLVTITTPEEQLFISAKPYTAEHWIGASDSQTEGRWVWMTGPDASTVFWRQSTSTVRRGTNIVDDVERFNWWGDNFIGIDEPNDCEPPFCGPEHVATIRLSDNGRWFDRRESLSFGAIYEYGTGTTPGVDRGVTSTGMVIEVVDRLTPLIRYADGLDATAPTAAIWTEAEISGVGDATISAALASALASPTLDGSRVATVAAAQEFVDAMLRIHAYATDPTTAPAPTTAYVTIGINGLNSTTTATLNAALRTSGPGIVADHAQLRALAAQIIADAAAAATFIPPPPVTEPDPEPDIPEEPEPEPEPESEPAPEPAPEVTEAEQAPEPPPPPAPEPTPVIEEAVAAPEEVPAPLAYVIAPTAASTPGGLPVVARLDGSPLRLSPMATYALVDGAEVSLAITQLDEATVRLSGPGIEVTLISTDPAGSAVSADAEGRLLLVHGGQLRVEAAGFLAGTRIDTWAFSTPTFLGGGSADGTGSIRTSIIVPEVLAAGSHTFQITGPGAESSLRAISIGVLVEAAPDIPAAPVEPPFNESPPQEAVAATPVSEKAPPFEPFSALDAPAALVSAAVSGVALLAVAAGAGAAGAAAGMRSGGSQNAAPSEERSELSGIYVADLETAVAGSGRGDDSALWRWPGTGVVDRLSVVAPAWLAPRWPMVARIVDDGTALRAMFGSLAALSPMAGLVLGLLAVIDTAGIAMPPATNLAIAIILLGVLDAFSGFVAFAVFALGVVVSGGIIDVDSVRALMGIAVVFFGPALLAGAFRSLRRPPATDGDERWERITDYVVVPLIAAMSAQAMVGALSGVAGVAFPLSEEAHRIALMVAAAMVLRIMIEDVASRWFPARLTRVTATDKPAPSTGREALSVAAKTGVYGFVVVAIIGNVWQLWVAAAMFAGPMLLGLIVDRLPNSPLIWRLLPQGVPSIVTNLLVSTWCAVLLETLMGETEAYAQTGFMLFGVPFMIMALMGLVGREPAEGEVRWCLRPRWRPVYRVGGIAMLALGMYLHLTA